MRALACLVVAVAYSLALVPSSTLVATAAVAPFCSSEAAPSLDPVFADLQAALGDPLAEAAECAHPVLGGTMVVQHLASGAVVFNQSTGEATFTDGAQFWTLGADGTLATSTDPPDGVLPALLASAPTAAVPPMQATAVPSPAATGTPAPATSGAAPSEADIAARAAPSVVQISVPGASGSGVAIAGGILTNQHVIDGAASIDVITASGQRAHAEVLRSNTTSDLALLRAPDLNLPPLELEAAGQQRQGDTLLVLGYPLADLKELGGQATLTRGLLSAVRAQSNGVVLVQTDAAINPGNSGGPLLNVQGKVIGIVAFGIEHTQGLSFGVAAETIQAFLDGPGGVAPSTHLRFQDDPRTVAATLGELPNGGSGWSKIDEDTAKLDKGIYAISFGKLPAAATALPLPDPLLLLVVAVAPSVEDAQHAWPNFSKLDARERPGATLPPLGDDQMYALAPSTIDVRVRTKNVLIEAVEMTSGQQAISLDDTVAVVRTMVAHVSAHLR
jgi:S1-C subfamily serine protease